MLNEHLSMSIPVNTIVHLQIFEVVEPGCHGTDTVLWKHIYLIMIVWPCMRLFISVVSIFRFLENHWSL